ncbi:hypothetical protein ACHRV1_02775 [Flavobacterium aquidurense]|jgi:hypothetical protein|uniref:hypothetical protein n=1 Tax=Flavobacterium aquidurense TaxID=362413 RepID=UPI00103F615A
MKLKSNSSKENIFSVVLFASIGFLLGLVSYFLIKILSIILTVLLVVAIAAWWNRNENNK